MKENFIVVGPGSDYGNRIFSDIRKIPNGIVLDSPVGSGKSLLSKLHHIHFSFYLNKKINLPFKKIWNKYYSLSAIDLKKDEFYYILFTDVSACRYSYDYIKKISEMSNVFLMLDNLNIVSAKKKLLSPRFKLFDLIFSFDKSDAEKYDFIFWPLIYSTPQVAKNNLASDSVLFVGNSKNRLDIIHSLYENLMNLGIPLNFYISKVPKKKQIFSAHETVHYNEWVTYQTVLELSNSSQCIVEIVDPDQVGLTLRSAEAILLNKKLLTNNKSILMSKFYNKDYIQVFDDPSNIDISFFDNSVQVDFEYDNSFSPIELFNYAVKKRKEGK